jgi:hypothetical protein
MKMNVGSNVIIDVIKEFSISVKEFEKIQLWRWLKGSTHKYCKISCKLQLCLLCVEGQKEPILANH